MPHCFVEFEIGKIKDNFEVEIADAFIRLESLCGYLNIDIENFINVKMQINKRREPFTFKTWARRQENKTRRNGGIKNDKETTY